MKIFDNENHLKELVEHSSTFFCGTDLDSDVEVVNAETEIIFSNKKTIIIDSESQHGMLFEDIRYSYEHLKHLRPNSIILVPFFDDKISTLQFYPIDWVKVVSANKPFKPVNNTIIKDGLCMLGGWTPCRKIIYEKLLEYHKSVMISYYPRQSGDWDENHSKTYHYYVDPCIKQADIKEFRNQCIFRDRLFTQENVQNIHDNNIIHSQIIPKKLFSHTRIQFVAETEDDFKLKEFRESEGFYVTEKSGKALYSGLPWVIYGAEGFLKNLQTLGFKTFSDIIDESYDEEHCPFKRAHRAADSFIEFIKQPERIKKLASKKVKTQCIHNRELVSNLKIWTAPVEEKIKKIL